MTIKPPTPVDVPRFLRAVEKTNPFKRDAVTGTRGADVDVQEIHRKEFLRILQQVESVRSEGGTAGVLLLAPAGVGKSHLLARLDRWAREDGKSTMVILHNLIAAPERMARAVLGATVNLLVGAREVSYPQSDLYALLNYAIGKLYRGRGAPSTQVRLNLLREAGRRLDPQGDVIAALCAFLENTIPDAQGTPGASERAQLAVEWLSGQEIDSEQGRELGLSCPSGEITAIEDGKEERVLLVLAGLSAITERPFILCLDQVDNLHAEGIAALTRFLHAVIDHANNLVVITSGVKDAMLTLREQKQIPDSAWHRIAQTQIHLPMVLPPEARKIVSTRVDRFMEPFRLVQGLEPYRHQDPLFPLSTEWLDKQLIDVEVRPRDVIIWCRERWAQEQLRLTDVGDTPWLRSWGAPFTGCATSGRTTATVNGIEALVDEAVSLKIKESVAQRQLRPQGLPPDEGRFSELVLTLLACCRNRDYSLVDYESCPRKPLGPYHLWVTERANGRDYRNGVTFVATTSKAAATNALKRITADKRPPDHRILITDERRHLEVGPKGREYLATLEALGPNGFLHMQLRFEDYALLDALAGTLGAARVGDLELEWPPGKSRQIGEAEAIDAMHRQKWFLKQPLLAELLTEETPKPPRTISSITLNPVRAREFVVAELSWRILATARELTEIYLQREGIARIHSESIWQQLKDVARALADGGQIDVTASEDDLFLQSMGKK
jgi:hypothetical protein